MFITKRLDLHIHARRQVKLHQRVHRLLRRLENVEQTLVGPDSNCSRDFLSTCGERSTQYLFFMVGSGIGPAI